MITSKRVYVLLLTTLLAVVITPAAAQQIELRTERGGISNDGRIKLVWSSAGKDVNYLIEQSTDDTFSTSEIIYNGPDRASFISGLQNGTYYFRVKPADGTWSSTLDVKVKHHSLQLAFALFALGALVFLLTVLVVVRGSRMTANTTN